MMPTAVRVGAAGDQSWCVAQSGGDFGAEQQRGQKRLRDSVGGGAVNAPRRRQRYLAQCRFGRQRLQVVANDLGGEVEQRRLLRQARDMLEIEAVPEAFEGLLDTPALVARYDWLAQHVFETLDEMQHFFTNSLWACNHEQPQHGARRHQYQQQMALVA